MNNTEMTRMKSIISQFCVCFFSSSSKGHIKGLNLKREETIQFSSFLFLISFLPFPLTIFKEHSLKMLEKEKAISFFAFTSHHIQTALIENVREKRKQFPFLLFLSPYSDSKEDKKEFKFLLCFFLSPYSDSTHFPLPP